MYVFGAPGWSHDGSTLTIKQIQKELRNAEIRNLKLEPEV